MDDIKALFTAPHAWLFTVGVSACLGVWWAKMTPTMTNITLAFGVAAFTASAFFNPWVSAQPALIRAVWSIAICSGLSLAAYYTFWTIVIPLKFNATSSAAVQPVGAKIGGLDWKPYYTEVRLFIGNNASIDYKDIDLVIKPDKAVTASGQVTNIGGVSIEFHDFPIARPEWITTDTRERAAIPVIALASTRGYRIRCDVLPRHSIIELVFAAVSVNDKPTTVELDKLFKIKYKDGTSVWFAHSSHSEQVFGPRPEVASIAVEGQYIAGGQKVTIRETLSVVDHIANALPNLIPQR